MLSTVKQSEDLRGWLVRGYNLTGDEIEVTLKPLVSFKNAELINLAEQKLSSLKSATDGSVSFHAGGHEIVTVLFKG